MTTQEVIAAANPDGLATPGMDLSQYLRRAVIPKFLAAVGYVSWRRVVLEITVPSGNSTFSLPTNAGHVKQIFIGPTYSTELEYVGEDRRTPLQFDLASGSPSKYYFFSDTAGLRVQMNKAVSTDTTYKLIYDTAGLFGDEGSTDVGLNQYIPPQWQWALVEGLKQEIYRLHYGAGDRRAKEAGEAFAQWISLASESREMTIPVREIYVR